MTTANISLFQALGSKINHLQQSHNIIASNIANADTPGYRPHEIEKVDFGRVLSNVTESNKLSPAVTNVRHMPTYDQIDNPDIGKQKKTYESAPAGNAVIMEEQLVKSNKTMMDYSLMLNIYKKNVGMLKTAIGK